MQKRAFLFLSLWILAVGLTLLLVSRYSLEAAPTSGAQRIEAGHPFVEHDPSATLLCVSNRDGFVLPPFEMTNPGRSVTSPGLAIPTVPITSLAPYDRGAPTGLYSP